MDSSLRIIIFYQFYVERDIETYSRQFRTSYRHWHDSIHWTWYIYVAVWVNVQTDMHRPITSTYNRTIYRNHRRTWCAMIYTDVNNLYDWVMYQRWFSLGWWRRQFWFWYWFIINVMLNSLMSYVLEVNLENPQHVHSTSIYRLTREKALSKREEKLLQHCMIKSVTSYIIAICSNVLVTVFALQRSIVYCNSRNLHDFANTQYKF